MKNVKCINRKSLYMILSVIICSAAMSFVDAVIQPQYIIKSLIKLVLFLVVPIVYFLINKKDAGGVKKLFKPKGKDLLRALLLGAAVYGVIVGGYFLLRGVIDFSALTESLTKNIGVSAENFIYVSLYISLVNSFLEEFFFRGFAFINLKSVSGRAFAYVFSALLFALYHSGMTAGFDPVIFVLALIGLFAAGVMFNFLNEKSENIYTSWLVHMFANFGINTIGFIVFGII